MSDINIRTALITGASSGIGAAIAGRLAEQGVRVALAARSEEKLREVAAGLPAGSESMIVPADVGDEEQVRHMVAETEKRFGAIDLLVNNAGFGIFKPIVELTAEEFDGIIRVNLRGAFLCMKYTLPGMYERERGTVVNISSVAGKHGFAGGGAYCSSKFGLMGLTECVFQEARTHNVRIVTISPGSVDTPMLRWAADLWKGDKTEDDMIASWGKMHPLGRVGTPEDVAELIAFLAGPRASFITGGEYKIDGGLLSAIAVVLPE